MRADDKLWKICRDYNCEYKTDYFKLIIESYSMIKRDHSDTKKLYNDLPRRYQHEFIIWIIRKEDQIRGYLEEFLDACFGDQNDL